MQTKQQYEAETRSSLSPQDTGLSNISYTPGYFNVAGKVMNGRRIKPVEIDPALLHSLQNDELYSAIVEVCLRRGYIRITTPQNGGIV